MKHTDMNILINDYKKLKDWKGIYQWKRISSIGNSEIISEWLLRDFEKIKFDKFGLRENNFKIKNHEGYCKLQTEINQFTEKRFCRALFNKYNENEHPLLGKILDYEVPLTAPKQEKTEKVNQGDFDLVSKRNGAILVFEVKKAQSNESLLKAILQIFTYVTRLSDSNLINEFLEDYNPDDKKITPCILTFNNAASGKQISEIEKYPKLQNLIAKINSQLEDNKIGELEFYIVDNPNEDYTSLLDIDPNTINKKSHKIVLRREVNIIKYKITSSL